MAHRSFLKLNGYIGPVETPYKGWFEVLSWSWAEPDRRKSTSNRLNCVMPHSFTMINALNNGHFDEAILVMTSPELLEFSRFVMSDVIVENLSFSGNDSGIGTLIGYTLSFAKLEVRNGTGKAPSPPDARHALLLQAAAQKTVSRMS